MQPFSALELRGDNSMKVPGIDVASPNCVSNGLLVVDPGGDRFAASGPAITWHEDEDLTPWSLANADVGPKTRQSALEKRSFGGR